MPKIVKDQDIYQAVIRIISERGFIGATTRQMAAAAEVSEVTLFRKYGSKLQLVKQAFSALIARTNFEAATRYTGDVTADLLRLVRAYQGSAVKHGQLIFTLLSEMPRSPELADLLQAPLSIYELIERLLAAYQETGILRQEHPRHALAALLGPMIYDAMLRKGLQEQHSAPPLDLADHVNSFLEGRLT